MSNENYIMLNNQKIEFSDEQISKIKEILQPGMVKLEDIPEEETFKIGKYEFIVLEHDCNETYVILKDLYKENVKFGENNNYIGSDVEKICAEFAEEIENIIGDCFVEHVVDLTSNDGLKDYCGGMRKVALMTAEEYRTYVSALDKHKLKEYWWLATPNSTDTHGCHDFALCVSLSGRIYFSNCYYGNFGVRPFCIFKSNIFVSK